MIFALQLIGALLGAIGWVLTFSIVLMETGKEHALIKFLLAPLWAGKIVIGHILPLLQDPQKW